MQCKYHSLHHNLGHCCFCRSYICLFIFLRYLFVSSKQFHYFPVRLCSQLFKYLISAWKTNKHILDRIRLMRYKYTVFDSLIGCILRDNSVGDRQPENISLYSDILSRFCLHLLLNFACLVKLTV